MSRWTRNIIGDRKDDLEQDSIKDEINLITMETPGGFEKIKFFLQDCPGLFLFLSSYILNLMLRFFRFNNSPNSSNNH